MSQRAIAYVHSIQQMLTEGEYAVAMVLATLARDADDAAEVTMERLGELAGVKERAARYTIRHLESYGLVTQVYQKKGLRRSRTTYTFVELEDGRTREPRDTATVVSLAKALRRKSQAARTRSEECRQQYYRDPLLLATLYEEMARSLREEHTKPAADTGS